MSCYQCHDYVTACVMSKIAFCCYQKCDSTDGLVVEFSPATWEALVRFSVSAKPFFIFLSLSFANCFIAIWFMYCIFPLIGVPAYGVLLRQQDCGQTNEDYRGTARGTNKLEHSSLCWIESDMRLISLSYSLSVSLQGTLPSTLLNYQLASSTKQCSLMWCVQSPLVDIGRNSEWVTVGTCYHLL